MIVQSLLTGSSWRAAEGFYLWRFKVHDLVERHRIFWGIRKPAWVRPTLCGVGLNRLVWRDISHRFQIYTTTLLIINSKCGRPSPHASRQQLKVATTFGDRLGGAGTPRLGVVPWNPSKMKRVHGTDTHMHAAYACTAWIMLKLYTYTHIHAYTALIILDYRQRQMIKANICATLVMLSDWQG